MAGRLFKDRSRFVYSTKQNFNDQAELYSAFSKIRGEKKPILFVLCTNNASVYRVSCALHQLLVKLWIRAKISAEILNVLNEKTRQRFKNWMLVDLWLTSLLFLYLRLCAGFLPRFWPFIPVTVSKSAICFKIKVVQWLPTIWREMASLCSSTSGWTPNLEYTSIVAEKAGMVSQLSEKGPMHQHPLYSKRVAFMQCG